MFGTKSRIVRLTAALLALVCVSIGLSASPVSAFEAAVGETGTVTGRVVRDDGGSVDQIDVEISGYSFDSGTFVSWTAKTNSSGQYSFPDVELDLFLTIYVYPSSNYLNIASGGGEGPTTAGETVDMGDITLVGGGAVTGTISVPFGVTRDGTVSVCLAPVSGDDEESYFCSDYQSVSPGETTSYTVRGVVAGSYVAQLSGDRFQGPTYFNNAETSDEATPISVTKNVTTSGINFSASFKPYTLKPVGPNRAIETRSGRADGAIKVAKAKVGPAKALDVKLAGVAGVPSANVAAASLVVTVTNPSAAGYVTVYPCGQRPTASNLNFAKGQTVANAVVAPLSGSGHVCFFASVNTDLIVDVNGYMAAGGGFVPRTPARLMETRPGRPADLANVSKTKVRPGATRRIDLTKISGLSDSVMLSLNVTATGSTGEGHVSVYPCTSASETTSTSTLNFAKGATVANAALVATVDFDQIPIGGMCVSSSSPVDVLIDINGIFDSTSEGSRAAVEITGGRLYDTRPGKPSYFDTKGKIGGSTVLNVLSIFGDSEVANVTVVSPGADGYITVYPCAEPRPTTSNINFSKGKTVAGLVMSGNSGGICIYSSTPVDLIVDAIVEV